MSTRWERFKGTFALDLRSLALLRILLGFMLLLDLVLRAPDLTAHYTDAGLVPRDLQFHLGQRHHPFRFSLHMLSGELSFQISLFIIAGGFAVALALGFHTRIAHFGSLALFLSLLNRNGQVTMGIDAIVRLVCLWTLFLPLGARFSLDRRAGRVRESPQEFGDNGQQHFSMAGIALILQMFTIYFFSAIHKDHDVWRKDFTAVHYALHIDSYDTTLGTWLRQFPFLTSAMTRGTMILEFAAPWLLFGAGVVSLIPRLEKAYDEQASLRTAAAVVFMLFHLGLGLTIALGTFPWFVILIWFGLLPGFVWETLNDFIDRNAETRSPSDLASKAAAALGRVRELLLRTEGPGRTVQPKRAQSSSQTTMWAKNVLAGFLAALVLLINLRTLDRKHTEWFFRSTAPVVNPIIDALRLDQNWALFAPSPRRTDGHYVLVGDRSDGTSVDLLRDDLTLTWQKPTDVSASYGSIRGVKLHHHLKRRSGAALRDRYLEVACQRYQAEHPNLPTLKTVTLYFLSHKTLKKGGYGPTKKEKLLTRRCRF